MTIRKYVSALKTIARERNLFRLTGEDEEDVDRCLRGVDVIIGDEAPKRAPAIPLPVFRSMGRCCRSDSALEEARQFCMLVVCFACRPGEIYGLKSHMAFIREGRVEIKI